MKKLGPNERCPCRSGMKVKKCTCGVDWGKVLSDPNSDPVSHLSLRGKNIFFLERIAAALQLDKIGPAARRVDFKKAFTKKAVREIAEAIIMTWPSGADLRRVLFAERPNSAGLYTGSYDPASLRASVTRHSLYADCLLLADPLLDPRRVRAEFSPIENPLQHRSATLRWVTLWLSLSPWIDAGIVKFIRSPGDFDRDLDHYLLTESRQRAEEDQELAAFRDDFMKREADRLMESYKRQLQLGMPDTALREAIRRWRPDTSPDMVERIIAHIRQLRDDDPYFVSAVEKPGDSELLHLTTGMSYLEGKLTATIAGAHFVTDLELRWKELELDRERAGFDPRGWTAFAKAFQGVTWPHLNSVPLQAALTLRKENRLEDLRSFLRKTWKAASPDHPFDDSAATNLQAELNAQVREAEVEWMKIDRDLVKWFGSELGVGLLSMGPVIAAGHASWAAGGLAAAAATNLLGARRQRAEWEKKFPAGFFLKLRDEAFGRQAAT